MKWPNLEDQLLATCCRSEFGEADRASVVDICRKNGIRWKRVYSTARMHGVAPLVYLNLARTDRANLGMNNGTAERFRRSFARNLGVRRRFREEFWQILGFFNERGVDVMLIKADSIDLFGSGPYTVSRDIDLIVRAHKEDLPDDMLAQMLAFSDGFPLEYDFYGHHDIDMNGVLPIDWGRVWADAIPVRYRGRDFHIMAQEDALIAACINACRKRYFNLKALGDIDWLLQRTGLYSLETFFEKAWAYECNDIACAALMAAEQLMETQLADGIHRRLSSTRGRYAMLLMLVRRFSFSNLSTLYDGHKIAGRPIQQSLLLPYASYRSGQVWAKLKFAVRSRSPHATPIRQGSSNAYSRMKPSATR